MNPFQALAEGRFLPIIVFAIIFGLAARSVIESNQESNDTFIITKMLDLFSAMQKTIFRMVNWLMYYFPIGIFALTTVNFAIYGVDLFGSYASVAGCVIAGILLMMFFILIFFFK